MEKIFILIILIGMGIVCSFIHKGKGYSPIAGFFWGFCFNIIGLLIVLFERNKDEQVEADKNHLSMGKWLMIFLGVGILGIIIFLVIILNQDDTKTNSTSTNTANSTNTTDTKYIDSNTSNQIIEDLETSNVSAFNSTFESYAGDIKGSRLKLLISTVANNNTSSAEHKISVSFDGILYVNSDVSDIKNSIISSNTYNVKIKYDKNGFVNNIIVR